MSRAVPMLLLAAVLGAAGCRYPQDPNRTLDRVEGGQLVVGALGGAGDGLTAGERAALEALARRTKARLKLVRGEPHTLFAGLEKGDVHLIAGGIPADTPWKTHAGLSDPVEPVLIAGEKHKAVFAVRKGENAWLIAVNGAIAEARGGR